MVATFASDKKAEEITILDMRCVVSFCDFFVICTGNSNRQVQAIAEGAQEGLINLGMKINRVQGFRDGQWVLLDLGDVVLHVFEREIRGFYGLDYLWQEAKIVNWKP